ncbi:MarR family transcriptional regulator [Streptomyces bauhiniae]|uniref:MarR family transcriptional regulator n=1 Tax=Streptomyces bauhiniae TaxID=2340725 RepID=A0A4Z1DAZ1_9ACTN|nr:MarR family transcriptional regulator [Streptomyces bauhiniae]TGN79456.1 MarR family transcriptional regulator [Streptomyces bauhiniae]
MTPPMQNAHSAQEPTGDHLPQAGDAEFQEFTRAVQDLLGAVRRSRGRLAGQTRPALSLSQVQLLESLADHGTLGVSEMAEHAGVTTPTATRMLKQLERDGIVTRTRKPGNERRVEIELTEAGAGLLAEHRARLRERQLRAFRELTPEHRAVATELTRRLSELVDEM